MTSFALYEDFACTRPFGGALPMVEDPSEDMLGRPARVFVRNERAWPIIGAEINLFGEGAEHVQLAVDADNQPGQWAAPGGGVILGRLDPQTVTSFWARAMFAIEDAPAMLSFELALDGTGVIP